MTRKSGGNRKGKEEKEKKSACTCGYRSTQNHSFLFEAKISEKKLNKKKRHMAKQTREKKTVASFSGLILATPGRLSSRHAAIFIHFPNGATMCKCTQFTLSTHEAARKNWCGFPSFIRQFWELWQDDAAVSGLFSWRSFSIRIDECCLWSCFWGGNGGDDGTGDVAGDVDSSGGMWWFCLY